MTDTAKQASEQENLEFNQKWHLASSNRMTVYGNCYQRPGEPLETANVGAWYETAVYWRNECEKLERETAALREEVERLRSALRETVINFHLSHKYSPEGITIPPISTCGHPICEAAWKLVREGQKGSE